MVGDVLSVRIKYWHVMYRFLFHRILFFVHSLFIIADSFVAIRFRFDRLCVRGITLALCEVPSLLGIFFRYQQMLHRNLVYLATIADNSQTAPNMPPVSSVFLAVVETLPQACMHLKCIYLHSFPVIQSLPFLNYIL
jgi:SSXT protein (N-terminal region)